MPPGPQLSALGQGIGPGQYLAAGTKLLPGRLAWGGLVLSCSAAGPLREGQVRGLQPSYLSRCSALDLAQGVLGDLVQDAGSPLVPGQLDTLRLLLVAGEMKQRCVWGGGVVQKGCVCVCWGCLHTDCTCAAVICGEGQGQGSVRRLLARCCRSALDPYVAPPALQSCPGGSRRLLRPVVCLPGRLPTPAAGQRPLTMGWNGPSLCGAGRAGPGVPAALGAYPLPAPTTCLGSKANTRRSPRGPGRPLGLSLVDAAPSSVWTRPRALLAPVQC